MVSSLEVSLENGLKKKDRTEELTTRQKKAIREVTKEIRNNHLGGYRLLKRLIEQAGYIMKRRPNHDMVYSPDGENVVKSRKGFPIIIPVHSRDLSRDCYLGILRDIKTDFNNRYPNQV